MNNHAQVLSDEQACQEAVDFADSHPTPQAAWDALEDSHWMLWLIAHFAAGDTICNDLLEVAQSIAPYSNDQQSQAALTRATRHAQLGNIINTARFVGCITQHVADTKFVIDQIRLRFPIVPDIFKTTQR